MKTRVLLAGFALVLGQSVLAQEAAAPGQAAPVPTGVQLITPASDAENYKGDRIKYSVTVKTQAIKLGQAGAPRNACLPKDMELRGLGGGTLVQNGATQNIGMFAVLTQPDLDPMCNGPEKVQSGETVLLNSLLLSESPPNRAGWTFGTLLVPYKYQVKGDRSLSGGATLGGYAGYRRTVFGTGLVAIVFGGATKVDVPTQKDGSPGTESVAGVSYGVGVLGSIKDAFKLGIVIGADRVDQKLNYVNNGKAWISFSLGYDFYN